MNRKLRPHGVRTSIATATALLLLAPFARAGGASDAQTAGPAPRAPAVASDSFDALEAEGEEIYNRDCASCHGADGTGDGAGPALVGNPALANKEHVVRRILTGGKGMDPFGKTLSDRDVAAVATFVRNAWDNANGVVLETDVTGLRSLGR